MHYKRRSRRRDKRSMLPCGCCEDIRGGKALPRIDESEICNGKVKKKSTPSKESSRCLPGFHHEWYKETIEDTEYYLYCKVHGGRFCWRRIEPCDYERVYYKTLVVKKTCINCWQERILERKSNSWDAYDEDWNRIRPTWRGSKRRKIRTQDPVSGMTTAVRQSQFSATLLGQAWGCDWEPGPSGLGSSIRRNYSGTQSPNQGPKPS